MTQKAVVDKEHRSSLHPELNLIFRLMKMRIDRIHAVGDFLCKWQL